MALFRLRNLFRGLTKKSPRRERKQEGYMTTVEQPSESAPGGGGYYIPPQLQHSPRRQRQGGRQGFNHHHHHHHHNNHSTTDMPPSVCGPLISSKHSLLALTWTITTVLSVIAFCTAVTWTIKIETHYRHLMNYNGNNNNNNNNEDRRQILANHYDSMMNSKYFQQQEEDLDMPQLHRLIQDEEEGEGDGDKDGEGEGNDKDGESGSSDGSNEDEDEEEEEEDNQYIQLLRTRSTSMAFVVLYTTAWALALSMYGTTAIVGFTSISGVYIGPCFSQGDMKVGMFGGALVVFANLLLVCAVIFGEFRVSDNRDGHDNDEMEPYAVEQIASVLAITCMFLCILYILFALMLFIFHPSLAPGGKGATEVDPASIELVGDNKWRTSSGTFMNQRYA